MDSQPSQNSQQTVTYDLTALKKGYLYETRTFKYAPLIFGLIVGLLFVLRPLLIPQIPNFVFIGLAILLVFMIVFITFVKQALYVKSRTKFAEMNNLEILNDIKLKEFLPQSVIKSGAHSEKITGYRVNLSSGSVIVIDYSYTIGSGKNESFYVYGIATLQFNKEYPHIFLDSRSNGLNGQYQRSQRINLEGNFNKYFDLYMPEGSSAGTLTLLSPDVMQTMIDQVRPFDIEIDKTFVSLVTPGYGFTQETLRGFINASNELTKEFLELNSSWQPTYDLHGKPFELRRNNIWKKVAIVVIVYFAYFILTNIVNKH